MALVCTIKPPFDIETAICGYFTGASEYDLAVPRGSSIDFYELQSYSTPRKIKSVDLSDQIFSGYISSIKTIPSENDNDAILVAVRHFSDSDDSLEDKFPVHILFGGINGFKSIGNFQNPIITTTDDRFDTFTIASGKTLLLNYIDIFNGIETTRASFDHIIEGVYFLDANTVLVKTSMMLFLLDGDAQLKVIRKYNHSARVTDVSPQYLKENKNEFLVACDKGYQVMRDDRLLPIKPYAKPVPPLKFLKIGAKLSPLFVAKNGVFRISSSGVTRVLKFDATKVIMLNPYFAIVEKKISGPKLTIYSDSIKKVSSFDFNNINRVLDASRKLTGMHYGVEDTDGTGRILRNSLVFQDVGILSQPNNEPVENIFSVGVDRVLLCGDGKVSCVDHKRNAKKLWYRNIQTIYADEHYQVSPWYIYSKIRHCYKPLRAHIAMASGFKDMVVVASSQQVALLDRDLRLVRLTEEDEILNLVPGGYATRTCRKYFDGGCLEAPEGSNCSQIHAGQGFTFFCDQQNVLHAYQEAARSFVETELNAIDDSYDSGAGTVVFHKNDSYLIRQNSLISLENCGSKCLLSEDLKTCISLENGVVSIKQNTGIRLVETAASKYMNARTNSTICSGKHYVWHESEELGTHNTVHVYSSESNFFARYKLKKDDDTFYCYLMTSTNHLVEFAYSLSGSAGHKLRTYSVSDNGTPELKFGSDLMLDLNLKTIKGFKSQVEVLASENIILYSSDIKCTTCRVMMPKGKTTAFQISDTGAVSEKGTQVSQCANCTGGKRRVNHKIGYKSNEYGGNSKLVDFISGVEPTLVDPFEVLRNSRADFLQKRHFSYGLIDSSKGKKYIGYTDTSQKSSPFRLRMIDKHGFTTDEKDEVEELTSFNSFENLKVLKVSKQGTQIYYHPDFLVYGPSSLYTVTILPKHKAQSLMKIQRELCQVSKNTPSAASINGDKLLEAIGKSGSTKIFLNQNVNPTIFEKYLLDIYR